MLQKWILGLFVLLMSLSSLAAQDTTPLVAVVSPAEEISNGQIVFVDVQIRDVTALAGADVAVRITDGCLRFVERQDGNFLPGSEETGGFSPVDQLSDTEVRFATSITELERIATGSGVFYRVGVEASCDAGTGSIEIASATLSVLENPDDPEDDTLLSYNTDSGNLNIRNAMLTVIPAVSVTATPLPTLAPLPTSPAAQNAAPTTSAPATNLPLLLGIGLIGVSLLGFIILLIVWRSRK